MFRHECLVLLFNEEEAQEPLCPTRKRSPTSDPLGLEAVSKDSGCPKYVCQKLVFCQAVFRLQCLYGVMEDVGPEGEFVQMIWITL